MAAVSSRSSFFLKFEGDRDPITERQEGIIQPDGALVAEELEVAQAEPFGVPFTLDGKVLAGVHGEEESSTGKLVGGSVERAIIVPGQFPEDTRSERLLWAGGWVVIFVALQLV